MTEALQDREIPAPYQLTQLERLERADAAKLTIAGNATQLAPVATPWRLTLGFAGLAGCVSTVIYPHFLAGVFTLIFAALGTLVACFVGLGRHLFRSNERAKLAAWRQLAGDEEAPSTPTPGFTLLVAEKQIETDKITFTGSLYEWNEKTGWTRSPKPDPSGNGIVGCSVDADAPMHEIVDAWDAVRRYVHQVNAAAYQKWIEAKLELEAQRQLEQERASVRAVSAVQIAALLPGPSFAPKHN